MRFFPALAVLIFSLLGAESIGAAAREENNSLSWLAHNDVVYLSPALKGWEGLPLGNGGSVFMGLMDKINIWCRTLTPEEVSALSQGK
jgi:hypothetical protein